MRLWIGNRGFKTHSCKTREIAFYFSRRAIFKGILILEEETISERACVHTPNCLDKEGKRLDHDVVVLSMLPLSMALVVRLPSLSVLDVDLFFLLWCC